MVYDYYKERFSSDYENLVKETDKVDSAEFSLDEVIHPERYPYILLSMTIQSHLKADAFYWNLLVALLQRDKIGTILKYTEVLRRCDKVIDQNTAYGDHLKAHTRIKEDVAVTDFRPLVRKPRGNRFLVYALYPEAIVHMTIGCHDDDQS